MRQDAPRRDDVGAIDQAERFAHVVIGDEHADATFRKLTDQRANIGDRNGIDAREGLIEQHKGGIGRERPRDLQPTPLAARQGDGRRSAQMRDVELIEQLIEPRATNLLVALGQFQNGEDVLFHR